MASPSAPQRPAFKRKARPPPAGSTKRPRSAAAAGGDALGLLLQAAELPPSPPGQAQVQAEAGSRPAGACAAPGDADAVQSSGLTESLGHGASARPSAALAAQEALRQPALQGVETCAADSPEALGAGPQAPVDSQPSASQVPGSGAGPGSVQAAGARAPRVVGDEVMTPSLQPGDAEAAGVAAAHRPAAQAPGLNAPGSGQGKPTEAAAAASIGGGVHLDGQARPCSERNKFSGG